MNKAGKLAVLIMVFLTPLTGNAGGYVNGNLWQKMAPPEQNAYLLGVLDILNFEFSSEPQKAQAFGKCLSERTNVQMLAMVNKFIDDNPDKWHNSMPLLIMMAIKPGCW